MVASRILQFVLWSNRPDVFDPEKGVAMAVMKRALGTNETDSNYLDKVKKYLDQYKE